MTQRAFRRISAFSAAIFLTLSLVLVFVPELIFWLFALVDSEATRVIARRAGVLFLGLASIAWVLRHQSPSPLRAGLARSFAVAMLAMAILGGFEWVRGAIGAGVFLAIVAEVVLAALWFWGARADRSALALDDVEVWVEHNWGSAWMPLRAWLERGLEGRPLLHPTKARNASSGEALSLEGLPTFPSPSGP